MLMNEQKLSDWPEWISHKTSLQSFNTFGFDYQAEFLAVAESIEQLIASVKWAKSHDLPVTVIGGGSNLLIKGDVAGLVIVNQLSGIAVHYSDDDCSEVTFSAGENWHNCVAWSVDQGLGGIENLALIPGTAGAAPVQNIGAYGVEVKDTLQRVTALDLETLELVEIEANQCGFAYRESKFKHEWKSKYIITSMTVRLSATPTLVLEYGGLLQAMPSSPTIRDVFETVCHVRREKLPDPTEVANSGSFFKNPVVSDVVYQSIRTQYPEVVAFVQGKQWKLAAGWLNDRAGWKGYQENGVGVYPKQALVLVNYTCQKADALLALEAKIKASVYKTFGVELEREPVLLGGSV